MVETFAQAVEMPSPTCWIGVISLFPDCIRHYFAEGVCARAIKNRRLHLEIANLRDFSQHPYRRVDDRPYGGGAGMVLQYEPLLRAKQHLVKTAPDVPKVIYFSPQGKPFGQSDLLDLAQGCCLILVCGRYEGIDERFLQMEIDQECSVGDYVLSGGELPALIFMDGLIRQLPNTLGNSESLKNDSFAQDLLDYPHYTRPRTVAGATVPNILLSGDHQAIARWRRQQALGATWLKRPELLQHITLSTEDLELLQAFQADYFQHKR